MRLERHGECKAILHFTSRAQHLVVLHVEAAKKLKTLQPFRPSEVRLKPDTTSEDRDGHNPGTLEPDRGSRLGPPPLKCCPTSR
jgi:hypothetical protein